MSQSIWASKRESILRIRKKYYSARWQIINNKPARAEQFVYNMSISYSIEYLNIICILLWCWPIWYFQAFSFAVFSFHLVWLPLCPLALSFPPTINRPLTHEFRPLTSRTKLPISSLHGNDLWNASDSKYIFRIPCGNPYTALVHTSYTADNRMLCVICEPYQCLLSHRA